MSTNRSPINTGIVIPQPKGLHLITHSQLENAPWMQGTGFNPYIQARESGKNQKVLTQIAESNSTKLVNFEKALIEHGITFFTPGVQKLLFSLECSLDPYNRFYEIGPAIRIPLVNEFAHILGRTLGSYQAAGILMSINQKSQMLYRLNRPSRTDLIFCQENVISIANEP